ncbi:DNA polymerase I [Brucepastera parasyntrophica]|uniref:DNA polymerase I n=1 Tax=Brucepastera parasyntrophica TaxID=2880008 RepID=UPI00210E83CF|nr:DNA polymerase I [Brucepastera parasyntrophica]ULQ59368.1 DNA polymerase I [Brucepastera parasyntrophica]
MKKPLYTLDAYGLIYRSYFAFISRPLVNSQGKNVSAVFGFFRNLHTLFREYSPELFIAAFDSRTPTFRHEMYEEYKANRAKTPEDLREQIPVIEEILTALGIPIVRQDGFEADDIIASAAVRCREEKRQCIIISGDKDLMQLVGDHVSILKTDKSGGWKKIGSDEVFQEWGVNPEQMLDLLSLTGDASDNVPGIKGVGDKTAVKMLDTYHSLDGIYEHEDELQGAIGNKIKEGKESAYFSRRLIELCTNVPLEKDIDTYSSTSLDNIAAARLLMREGIPSVARLYSGDEKILSTGTADSEGNAEKAAGSSGKSKGTVSLQYANPLSNLRAETDLKQNTGKYRTLTDPDEFSGLIDAILAQKYAAFDCETTGLNVREDRLVGFSLALKTGEAVYVPVRGPAPELGEEAPVLMPEKAAYAGLSRLFTNKKLLLITHNGKFDYQIMKQQGLFTDCPGNTLRCTLFDTMIAAWLLDPDWSSFGLESLAASQLGLKTTPYNEIVPKGKTFEDVPIPTATAYAAEDADLTLQLYERFAPKLKEYKLDKLFTDMEMPLIPILADMELVGIRFEKSALSDFSVELEKEIDQTEKEIFTIVGHEFNIASPKQLQEVLFNERKLTPGKKTKTGFSTDTSVLEDLASEDIVPGKILDYRALAKLKSTYVDALPALVDKEGRIHTNFIQTGTATGRLSSRDPNLQNIPIRDDNGRKIRQAFRAADGYELISADYSQIELVILAHLSGDTNLQQAFRDGIDVHRRTASLIFGVSPEAVTPEMRRAAKTINFGVMYGMSAFRLANELRIPRGEAAGFINTYFKTYSGVASYITEIKEAAAKTGYVETIMGRRRYIRNINSSNRIERAAGERIAVNTPIQGSAADIVKTAMIKISGGLEKNDYKTRLLLQVHDELILEAPIHETKEVREFVRNEMESVIALAVPLSVSIESGRNWGDFH